MSGTAVLVTDTHLEQHVHEITCELNLQEHGGRAIYLGMSMERQTAGARSTSNPKPPTKEKEHYQLQEQRQFHEWIDYLMIDKDQTAYQGPALFLLSQAIDDSVHILLG